MSVFIGNVKGPHHNSPSAAAQVWCSPGAVELSLFSAPSRSLDPIAARNLAALLVRASEEAERMSVREMLDRVNEEKPRSGKSASLCLRHGGVGFMENCTECCEHQRLVSIARGDSPSEK